MTKILFNSKQFITRKHFVREIFFLHRKLKNILRRNQTLTNALIRNSYNMKHYIKDTRNERIRYMHWDKKRKYLSMQLEAFKRMRKSFGSFNFKSSGRKVKGRFFIPRLTPSENNKLFTWLGRWNKK